MGIRTAIQTWQSVVVADSFHNGVLWFPNEEWMKTGASLDPFYWGTCPSINLLCPSINLKFKFQQFTLFVSVFIYNDNRGKETGLYARQ